MLQKSQGKTVRFRNSQFNKGQFNKSQLKEYSFEKKRQCFLAVCTMLGIGFGLGGAASAQDMPNTCPVDGCAVSITAIEKSEGELKLTLDANFTADNSKNHFHMWWGEQYKPEQVGRNAKAEYNVEQGKWHRHDDYPNYITTGSASVEIRDGATTLCVTAADRDHNVLDAQNFHCMDVSEYL